MLLNLKYDEASLSIASMQGWLAPIANHDQSARRSDRYCFCIKAIPISRGSPAKVQERYPMGVSGIYYFGACSSLASPESIRSSTLPNLNGSQARNPTLLLSPRLQAGCSEKRLGLPVQSETRLPSI